MNALLADNIYMILFLPAVTAAVMVGPARLSLLGAGSMSPPAS